MDHFEVQAAIRELAEQRGVQIAELGRSVLGVRIPMIVLGEGERTVFFVGGIQGNEGAQTALLLAFVKEAVSLYGRGATLFSLPLTYLFSQYRICVIPLLNPDGMQYVNKGPGAENPLRERLAAKGLELVLSENVKDYLINQTYEPEYGARPLRRAVEHLLEDPLAEAILKGLPEGTVRIRAEVDNGKLLLFPEDGK